MKRFFSLFKASMTDGMNIFRVSTKKSNKFSKIGLPIFLSIVLIGAMMGYSEMIMESLEPLNMQFVLLTLFIVFT